MELLVGFDVTIPDGTPGSEVTEPMSAHATAAADLALAALPLDGWMQITVTPLEPHQNDPASPRPRGFGLPDPRASTRIETAAAALDWLNKGVFVSVGARRPSGVVYETHLVQ